MKKQTKPVGMTYRQFIFDVGRADALERTARYKKQQEEAEAQAKRRRLELAEAKKERFEEAKKAKEEREELIKQYDLQTSNSSSEPSASVKENKKQQVESGTDWAKWFKDQLDDGAAKQFVPSTDNIFKQPEVEDPTNFNYIIDPNFNQRYNANLKKTAEAAVDREIKCQYGKQIDAYNEKLKQAEEYDTIANAEIDKYNEQIARSGATGTVAFKEHVDTASKVKEKWENSDVFQKILATRDYILLNYTPNEALANKVLDYGTSQYNPLYTKSVRNQSNFDAYKTAKKEYDRAVSELRKFTRTYGMSGPVSKADKDAYQKLKDFIQTKRDALLAAEKAFDAGADIQDKYERNLTALSNSIRTQGLPKDKNKLTEYSKYIIDQLGLMDVLYNQDGSLNEQFVGVGYASDLDIKDAARKASDYFNSVDFSSGLNAKDEYLNRVSEDVELKKSMYQHLAQNDADAGSETRAHYRNEYNNLERASIILDKAKRHKELNNEVKRADGFWTKQTAKNIGYGIAEKAKDPGMWTLGISDLIEQVNNSNLADKIKNGQKLTQSEKQIANALAIESVMHQNYGEYEKTMGYKAGQVATESMKFMAEMALTSGGAAMLEAPGKAAMKAAANKYIRKYGADGFKNILGRNLAKTPGFLKMVGGDAAYSLLLANTLQMPSTLSEVVRGTTGELTPGVQDGDLTITGYEGEKPWYSALYDAEARAFTENMSEMMGEYGIGAFLKYPFKYFGKQAIKNSKPLLGAFIKGSSAIDNAQHLIDNMLPTKTISSFVKPVGSFIKAGHYSGIVGETAEEYYGNAMQHLLGVSEGTKTVVDENGNEKQVKTSFWEEINPTTELGKQTFLDIIGGIALSSGFLGAGSALNYARIAHNYDSNKKRLEGMLGKDLVEKIENTLTQSHSSNVASAANSIIRGISDASHREAFIDFYESMMKFHGASQADQKIRERNDADVFEKAKREAEINGYSIQYNTQRTDLQRAVDNIKQYAEQQLDIDENTIDDVIEQNGGIEELISYLKSTGHDSAASAVMAYNNVKTQYESSMRRLMDDIDLDLANNEKWVNRLADDKGNIVVGTVKNTGQRVYIKSGVRSVGGKLYKSGEKAVTVNNDGSIRIIDTKDLKDEFEEISANEVKHDLDLRTYQEAAEGRDLSDTSKRIGTQYQMSGGRIGTILNKTVDGRIMYSVNDPSTNTEVVRISDVGVTEEQLAKEWQDAYITEYKNNEIKKAQQQLNLSSDRTAKIEATKELREYIKEVKDSQRKDLESKHGRAIKYASGVLTSNSVDDVVKKIKDSQSVFVGSYVEIFANAGVTVDASNWERLWRLIKAFKSGQISKKEFKEILSDGSTKMNASSKENLENISVDKYGNVTRWKLEEEEDVNRSTHIDIDEYDLSEETLDESEELITKSIKDENKFLNSHGQRKLRGEAGRKAAKRKRAELKKSRKQKQAEKTKQNKAKLPEKINELVSEHKEPAPAPTPGYISDFVRKQVQFPNQKESLDKLRKLAQWTEANVLRDQTTSHNYFIMINGKRVMFTRVHGILDDQYENIGQQAKIDLNTQRLIGAYNSGGIEELKKEIVKLMSENKSVSNQSDQYTTYLDENPDEYVDVIEGVANVAAYSKPGVSVVFGQYVDELCRMFFGNEEITLDTQLEDGSFIKDHMTQQLLNEFIEQCRQLKSIYDALGWELITDRTVFTYSVFDNKLNKNVNVAGETDMIAVDKLGKYHIIDFKTSWKAFDTFFDTKGNPINLFESIPSPTRDGRSAKRSTKELYENQLTMYSLMVESTLEGDVDSIEIMPFTLEYDSVRLWFKKINNQQRVANNAKNSSYDIKVPQRILLTKNGELINRFSERKNDADVKAKAELTQALHELSSVKITDAIERLPAVQKWHAEQLAREINETVEKLIDAGKLVFTEKECKDLLELIHAVNALKEEFFNYVSEKVNDNEQNLREAERLRKEKEAAQQSHDAWLLKQASAQQKWAADWNAAFTSDYNKLLQLCKYLDNWAKQHNNDYTASPELAEMFSQLVSNLKFMIEFDEEVLGTTTGRILALDGQTMDKVLRCINWVENTVKEVEPVKPIVPPTSPKEYKDSEKSWQNTNGLFKDEFNGSAGVSSAVAEDNPELFLRDVTKNADFIDNSEFRVISKNGEIYVQITYGGHKYTPVRFFSAGRTEGGRRLYAAINGALRSAKSNQKVVITGGVKRSFGEFIVKEEGQYKSAHDHGMISFKEGEPGVNIYDIEYSSTQSTIGITYTREVLNGDNKICITEVRVPSSEEAAKQKFERQSRNAGWVTDKATGEKRRMVPDSPYALSFGSSIYTYSNVNQRKPRHPGIFVFMHNLGYTDDPECCVPVTMRRAFISENDAKFIIDALLGNYNGMIKKNTGSVSTNNPLGFSTNTTEWTKGFGGNVVIAGQTIDVRIADVLDLLIPVKGSPSYEAQIRRLSETERMPIYMDLDNVNETGEVLIIGNIEGDGIETMQRSFNIRTNDGIQQLELFLLKVSRNMNMSGFAQARLGMIGSITDQYGYPMPLSTNPTGGMTLLEYVQKNGNLRFGNSCIQFDKSDFSNPAIPGDTNGMTGMGWYLKNGFLECMYNGTEDPLIRIEDDAQISVLDDNPDDIKSKLLEGVSATPEVDMASVLIQSLQNQNSDFGSMLDGFTKQLSEPANKPINEEKARKNLERILGKDVPVKFIPTIIAVAKSGAKVTGICRVDGITLSKLAEEGVEYHEAFHRVIELLFTPQQRQKAYNKFREAKKGRENLTDKQIAELFADEFMYYATNQPIVKLHWNILKTFKEIKDWVDMWKRIGDYNLFRMYAKINSGRYANVRPDLLSIQDFVQRTKGKGFGYTANGHEFEHVLNGVHYKKLINFIAMSFMDSSVQQINVDGSNLDKFKLDVNLLIKKPFNPREDIPMLEDTSIQSPINFFTQAYAAAPESTKLALQEMIDNFDAIKKDIAAHISLFATDYKIKYEQDNTKKKEGIDTEVRQFDSTDPTSSEEDIEGSWIDNHTKESYEFAPITRMTQKTKFFFSGIEKKVLTNDGWLSELNELGLPEMYDAQYAFVTVLNEVSDCRSVPDLYKKLLKLGEHDGLFHVVAEKFGELWNDILAGKASADKLALVTQIFTQIKSTNSEFVLAKSSHNRGGLYDVQIEKTDQSYNAIHYVNDWAQSFAVGGCKFFRLKEDGSYEMNGQFTPSAFLTLYLIITIIAESADGKKNWTVNQVNKTKQQLCWCMNALGIPFTTDMLNKYLWSVYNNIGEEGFANFIRDNRNKILGFCNKIALLNNKGVLNITADGRVNAGNNPTLDKLFAGDQFLTVLANAKYMWHRAHDQMSVLIANNAKAYTKSENNLITDRLDELMYDEEAQHQLMSDAYNYNQENNTGSIFLKNRGSKLRFVTMGGFKTDEYGNAGIDYMQQSKREDYVGKMVALLDGYILSPTMSDKKTWGFISGLEHKMSEFGYGGTNFGQLFKDGIVVDEDGNITDFYIPDAVVNLMIEYAYCENASIKHVLDSFKLLPENKKVDNFHKGKTCWIKDGKVYTKKDKAPKDAVEVHPIQGARYTSLLGVYEDGNFIEFNQLVDEAGNYKDEWANYNTAQEKFFNKSTYVSEKVNDNEQNLREAERLRKEELKRIIRELLLNRIRAELKEVENLGLIKQTAVESNTKEVLFTYENVGLPTSRIRQIEQQIKSAYNEKELTVLQLNVIHSLAIVSLVADVTNRHIISMQEFERMFSGNPAFFKFGYDLYGHLVDRTVDQSKRLGGLVSTGTNNCLDMPGLPKDYTCVEVDNPMMVAEHIDKIKKDIYDGEVRSAYLRWRLEQAGATFDDNLDLALQISLEVDNMSISEIEEQLKDSPILGIVKKIAESKFKNFEKVDIADGAAYITDEMCENLLRMVGSWSNEIEEAFLILRGTKLNPKTNKPYNVSDTRSTAAYRKIYTEVIGAQKYTAYGYRYQDGVAVPYYNKMALFPMFKNMCTGDMAKIYKAAKDQNIDMIMIKSAVKLGGQSAYKITDVNNIDFANNSYVQKYAYLRKQFNTDPKEQKLMSMGTQMTKIVMSAIIPGRTYNVNGEEKTATQLRDDIMTAIIKLSDHGKNELINKFFKDGKFDIQKFSDVLRDELSSRGATKELIDGCQVVDGKMSLPLDAMSGMNWIQSILVSMINKKTIDINTPGHAFFQRSVWGMEYDTNILGDDDLPPSINGGEKLEVWNKDNSMDCVLSIDFFSNILKGTKAEHADFESQRKYLMRKGIIGPDAKANMIGYRIPTLAISSIHALRCVDVIPTVRDTVILPAEFTAITGSDYDIDKLFISMKHYQRVVDEERSTNKEIRHKTTDIFDKDTNPEEYYCNMLIDNYLALLKDRRTFNQLNGPIDSDTELLTSIVDDLEEGYEENALMPYLVSTLSFQSETKDRFVTGKVGIGPFALNNNNHILTFLYGIKFKEGYNLLLTRLGLNNLNLMTDRDGKSIMSWLSGLINAHVDVAKDPYISKLNVNSYTYNLVNLLVRTGLGKTTFYFTTQPIMKQLASVYNTASGVYMIEEGLSKTLAQRQAINDAIVAYVYANTGDKPESMQGAFKDFSLKFKADYGISTIDAIEILFSKECNVLHDISKGGSIEDLETKKDEKYALTDKLQLSMYEIQMLVAIANDMLKDPSEKLSDVVKYSKIDTKKLGKTMPEVESYARGVKKTFESYEAGTIFENIDKLYKLSYIKDKTNNAIDTFRQILLQLTIAATELFNAIIQQLLHFNKYEARNPETLSKITKAILAQVKSKFFFNGDQSYCKRNGIGVRSLIDGKNSIYNRLLIIKAKIMSQPEYEDYRDNSGNPINYLLQVLTSGYVSNTKQGVFENAKFVQIASITQSDEIDPQEITTAWDNLLHDDAHPELKLFARDLVVYAFLTSVDNGGNKDLFKYVPNSWKFESGYADYIEGVLEDFQNGIYDFSNEDVRDIVLNNTEDDFFTRSVKASKVTTFPNKDGSPSVLAGVRIQKKVEYIGGKVVTTPVVAFTYKSISDAPEYIKIKYIDSTTRQKSEHVYVKTDVGYINGTPYPIYTFVNSRTTRFKQGNRVYGYGTGKEVKSNVASRDFLMSVAIQKNAVKTTMDDSGYVNEDAVQNQELAVYESIMLEKKEQQKLIAPEAKKKDVWVRATSSYSRESVSNDPQTLYIFTDNTDRTSGGQQYEDGWYKEKYGEGGFGSINNPTTAQIRGLENAAPISTMRYFYRLHDGMTVADARWKDSDIEEFKKVIDSEIEDIKRLWDSGRFTKIVSPAGDGFFNSSIALINRDSEIGKYLHKKLTELHNYVNGVKSNVENTKKTIVPKSISLIEELLGRRIITPSNIPFVTERVQVLISGHNFSHEQLERFLRVLNQIVDILYENNNGFVTIPYYSWKNMREDEFLREHWLFNALHEGNFVDYTDPRYQRYNKKDKTIEIPVLEYKLFSLLSQNLDYLDFLREIAPDSDLADILTIIDDKYDNVGDMVTSLAGSYFSDGFVEPLEDDAEDLIDSLEERGIDISFSYSDSRQMEIDFDDSDQSDEMMKRCKE